MLTSAVNKTFFVFIAIKTAITAPIKYGLLNVIFIVFFSGKKTIGTQIAVNTAGLE
ncbi:hypothetical protein PSSHI_47830 [Photobacterium sp. R1]